MAISNVFYDVETFKCVGFLYSQGNLAMQVKKSISEGRFTQMPKPQ
jgi:hypothetical protein